MISAAIEDASAYALLLDFDVSDMELREFLDGRIDLELGPRDIRSIFPDDTPLRRILCDMLIVRTTRDWARYAVTSMLAQLFRLSVTTQKFGCLHVCVLNEYTTLISLATRSGRPQHLRRRLASRLGSDLLVFSTRDAPMDNVLLDLNPVIAYV